MGCENIQWARRVLNSRAFWRRRCLFLPKRRWPTRRHVTTEKSIFFLNFCFDVCSSWRLRDFERVLRLTESFTWEDQQTRDPHTGQRTLAGWIPHLQKIMKYFYAFTAFYRLVQSGVRIYVSHELVFSDWYNSDTISSPGYELITLIQVIMYFYCVYFYCNQLSRNARNWRATKVSFLKNQFSLFTRK
jgi:hypothetical protein